MMKKRNTLTMIAVVMMGMVGGGYAGETTSVMITDMEGESPPLEADRPDVTESPMTVPEGMWQLEMTTAAWSRDESDGETVRTWSFGQVNLKYGVTSKDDLQIGFDLYIREGSGGASSEGFGDVVLRWKHHLYGLEEESPFALAIMPFVKIPTGTALSNEKFEGGFVLPGAVELTDRISLGAQIEPSALYHEDTNDHEFALGHTLALAFDLGGDFGTYVEYVGLWNETFYEAGISTGITYDLNSNFRLDAGAYVGVNEAAEDMNIFTGLTYRF